MDNLKINKKRWELVRRFEIGAKERSLRVLTDSESLHLADILFKFGCFVNRKAAVDCNKEHVKDLIRTHSIMNRVK